MNADRIEAEEIARESYKESFQDDDDMELLDTVAAVKQAWFEAFGDQASESPR